MIGKIKRNIQDLWYLQSKDTLLVSYPKSGNTWVRFLICNYIEYLRNSKQLVDFAFLNKNMPELGYNLHRSNYFNNFNRVIKTHKSYSLLFRNNPVIYVIRHPQSVLKSFFIYNNNIEQPYFSSTNFSTFLQNDYGIKGYLNHYKSWQDHFGFLLKYEDLQNDTFNTLKKVLQYLKYPIIDKGIDYAVQMSSIKKVSSDKIGHKEKLLKGYKFAGNNAQKSTLSFSQDDIDFIIKMIKTCNFSVYSVDRIL